MHVSHRAFLKLFNSSSDRNVKETHWEKALSTAEKVVGYPTSFMNLRFWLSDEMSNVAVNMRKLIGTRHPLMKTAKGLIFDDKENIQTRGLVVLLMSKAAGRLITPIEYKHHELDTTYKLPTSQLFQNGILDTQRSLAEITEMIHTAFVLHKGVMDLNSEDKNNPETEDLLYGNKMALLSGDYLLAKASSGLASLGNTYVVETMASSISDLMESRFMLQDRLSSPDSDKPLTLSDWESMTYKSGACLYAKSCKSALMLSGHSYALTRDAFNFGRYFGFLRQIRLDTGEQSSESIYSVLQPKEVSDMRAVYASEARLSLSNMPGNEAKSALLTFINVLSS